MNHTIRQYQYTDYPALCNLYQEYNHSIEQSDTYQLIQKSQTPDFYVTETLHEVTKNSHSIFLVVEHQDTLIGFAVGIIKDTPSPEHVKSHLSGAIWELFVQEAHRNQGIASQLITQLEDHFKKHNCQYARLVVHATNQHAHKLYQKLGYQPWEHSLAKKL